MSRETRTIRPFVGIEGLESVLDETLLHFGPDSCHAGEGITVDIAPHEFTIRPVSIEWRKSEESFSAMIDRLRDESDAAGFAPEDLALVAIATSRFLKSADLLFEVPMSDIDTLTRVTELNTTPRQSSFRAPYSGFTVTTYLLLARNRPPVPLKPHRLGTWIASTQFRVDTTLGPALLPPTPLTDEIRADLKLPAKTMRYLHFRDHDLLEPYADQEQPVFYIDDDLIAQMNAKRRSPASKALQLQLAHDFVAATVRRAASRAELSDLSYEDIKGSLLGSVIRLAAGTGAGAADRKALLDRVLSDPEYVIARAEHNIDVRSGFTEALGDGDHQ